MPPRPRNAAVDIAERAALRALIEAHHGCISAMAKARSVYRQILARQIDRLGLAGEAADARRKGAVTGPRPQTGVDPDARDRLLVALAQNEDRDKVASTLGMSKRTLARRIAEHQITPDQVTKQRRALG